MEGNGGGPDTLDFEGKHVLILGMGAFAVENVRTCLLGGAGRRWPRYSRLEPPRGPAAGVLGAAGPALPGVPVRPVPRALYEATQEPPGNGSRALPLYCYYLLRACAGRTDWRLHVEALGENLGTGAIPYHWVNGPHRFLVLCNLHELM